MVHTFPAAAMSRVRISNIHRSVIGAERESGEGKVAATH